MKQGDFTPWGQAQFKKVYAEGIIEYVTSSHGGIWISDDRRSAMPKPIREHKTFAGDNWYEEDCDYALVVLSFPDLFSGRDFCSAIETAQMYFKHLLPHMVQPSD